MWFYFLIDCCGKLFSRWIYFPNSSSFFSIVHLDSTVNELISHTKEAYVLSFRLVLFAPKRSFVSWMMSYVVLWYFFIGLLTSPSSFLYAFGLCFSPWINCRRTLFCLLYLMSVRSSLLSVLLNEVFPYTVWNLWWPHVFTDINSSYVSHSTTIWSYRTCTVNKSWSHNRCSFWRRASLLLTVRIQWGWWI